MNMSEDKEWTPPELPRDMERPRKRPGSLDLGRICFARLLWWLSRVLALSVTESHTRARCRCRERGADDGFRLAGMTSDLGSCDIAKDEGWVLRSSGWRIAPEIESRDLPLGHSPTWRSLESVRCSSSHEVL